jgi:ribosomal protein L40E
MVICPKCGKENPKDSKYCEECGTRLINKKKKGRNYGIWGIVCAIGAIFFPRLGIVFAPAAIILYQTT